MSSPFNRSLFAQMPPSIVITEPVPRWKVWAQFSLKASALLLICLLSFYAGMRYERQPETGAALQSPVRSGAAGDAPDQEPMTVAAPAVPTQVPAAPAADPLLAQALEGLQIQSLNVARGRGLPGELGYEFVVANEGRPYEGNFEFLVLGVQDGRAVQWVFPPEGQRGSGAYRLRVNRYLKMSGKIQLPPGLTPQAVALTLREPAGVRASRGLVLPE